MQIECDSYKHGVQVDAPVKMGNSDSEPTETAQNELCPICRQNYEENWAKVAIQCSIPHEFHKSCLFQYFDSCENLQCPLCHRNVDEETRKLYSPFQSGKTRFSDDLQSVLDNDSIEEFTSLQEQYSPLFPGKIDLLAQVIAEEASNIFFYLWDDDVNVDAVTESGEPLLKYAVKNYYYFILDFLIQKGADVDKANYNGSTALMIASEKDYDIAVEFLLENGANVNKKDANGRNALMLAVQNGSLRIVQLLLRDHEDVDRSADDSIASITANEIGHLANGVDINATDNENMTALMFACWHNYVDICKLLLIKGADYSKLNNHHENALMLANHWSNMEIVQLLVERGAAIE